MQHLMDLDQAIQHRSLSPKLTWACCCNSRMQSNKDTSQVYVFDHKHTSRNNSNFSSQSKLISQNFKILSTAWSIYISRCGMWWHVVHNTSTNIVKELATSAFQGEAVTTSTSKTEAARSSETLVPIHQTAKHPIPEDSVQLCITK